MSEDEDRSEVLSWLIAAGAQRDVVDWCRAHASTWGQLWSECPRGDWLLGIAARAGVERERVVNAAITCVPVLEPYLPENEPAIERALRCAQAFADGESTQRLDVASELDALLARTNDPSAHAATMAMSALVASIDDPASAATFVAATVQAAVMDAGDCGMIQAARFTEHACAERVRVAIPIELVERALLTVR